MRRRARPAGVDRAPAIARALSSRALEGTRCALEGTRCALQGIRSTRSTPTPSSPEPAPHRYRQMMCAPGGLLQTLQARLSRLKLTLPLCCFLRPYHSRRLFFYKNIPGRGRHDREWAKKKRERETNTHTHTYIQMPPQKNIGTAASQRR